MMAIEVRPYVKSDGWKTRYWAIYAGGELLAVVVYKKGALVIADGLRRGLYREAELEPVELVPATSRRRRGCQPTVFRETAR